MRLEKRILRIDDEVERLRAELAQIGAEADVHRHLADDAARDAAVYDTPFDREDARETAADVDRFERLAADLQRRIDKLRAKRAALVARLGE